MENIKDVFCTDNLYEKRRDLKQLKNLISKHLNCELFIRYSQNKIILGSLEDIYQDCLSIGKYYAIMYDLDVDWINVRGELRPLKYVSVMYGLLPEDKRFDINEEINDQCPHEIAIYIYNLQRFLVNKKVFINYNKKDNVGDC